MSQYTASSWSQAPLAGYTTTELQRALDVAAKHPDAYKAEDSPASITRRRLAAEINQRVTNRLNQLNTTRKPQPLP